MGQVSPRRAAGHPAPSQIPGWTMGWSRRGSPQAFASCKNQYGEDWERWGLGRLQIPALLLGEEVQDDGCGPPRPQAAVGDHKKKKKKKMMRERWGCPPRGRRRAPRRREGFGPRLASPRAHEGTLQTSWQPQARRSSGFAMVIKTPRSECSRLSPSRHLRAGAAGTLARPGTPCGYPAPYRPAISKPTR